MVTKKLLGYVNVEDSNGDKIGMWAEESVGVSQTRCKVCLGV